MAGEQISVTELCNSVGANYRVLGAMDRYVTAPAPIHEANQQSVSFWSRQSDDPLQHIRDSNAGVIICSSQLEFAGEDYRDKTLILVPNPRLAFIRVMRRHFAAKSQSGVSPTAVIDDEADIHPNVYIGPNCYIGKCEIGEGTVIHANVHVYPRSRIGRNVIIHAGTVVGSEGQAYERDGAKILRKFPQIGGVVIEDDVEIGSNVSIMRGTFGTTVIGEGTKVGHLCSIGHNVVIGKHCLIITHSAIGGSSHIGDYSQVSLGACIRDGIEIGRHAVIGMGSVVTKNVDEGQVVFGVPARERRERQRDEQG